MIKEDCEICKEINGEPNNRLHRLFPDEGFIRVTAAETENFVMMPSIGPLTLGHSLIVPKEHRCSIFDDKITSFRDLEYCLEQAPLLLGNESNNKSLFCFEHGIFGSLSAASLCSTSHAHLHLVPLDIRISEKIFDTPSFISEVIDFGKAVMEAKYLHNYLMWFILYENSIPCTIKLSDSKDLPSQYLRQIIGNRLGVTNWNWKEEPNLSLFKRSISIFRRHGHVTVLNR